MPDTLEGVREKFKSLRCEHEESMDQVGNHFKLINHLNLRVLNHENLNRCAILLVLFKTNNKFHILLTIRGFELKSFPGEIW